MKIRKLLSLMLVLTMLVSLFSGVSMSALAADNGADPVAEGIITETAEGEAETEAETPADEPPAIAEAPAEESPGTEEPAEAETPAPEEEAQPEEPVEEEPEAGVDDSEPYVLTDKIVDRTEYVLAYQDEDTGKFYVVTNKDGALAVSELDNLTVDAVATVENSVWTVEDGAFSSEDYYLNVKDGKVVLDEDESDIWKFDHDDQCPFTEEEDGNYLLAVEDGTLKAYDAEDLDEDADLVALYVVKSVAESEAFKNYEEPEPEEPAEEEPVEEEPAEIEEPAAEETMEEEPADEEPIEEEPAEAEEPAAEETVEEEPAEDAVVAETLGTDGPGFDIVPIDESEEEPEVAVEETEAEEPGEVPAIEPDTPVASSAEESEVLLEKAPEGKAAAKAAAAEAQAAETPVVRGNVSGTVLAFTSDVHNGGSSASGNAAANRMDTWIDHVLTEYGHIDVMGFCGDMASARANGDSYWTFAQAAMDVADAKITNNIHTTGNHEFMNGSFGSTSNATANRFVVGEQGAVGTNYYIYCMGTTNWDNYRDNYTTAQITALNEYLGSVGSDKPIIILAHFPLHYYSSRTTTLADSVIESLNAAAGSGKKIVFLWGHNHSVSDANYDQIFAPGDTIVSKSGGTSQTIQFFYAAAGCMSDIENGTGSRDVVGKGLVMTIDSANNLSFTYYDENGTNVTEGGTYTEGPPVDATAISLSPETLSVEIGASANLTVTYEPSTTTNRSVTWTSSDPSVATVSSSGVVTGVAKGTATITATYAVSGVAPATATVTVTKPAGQGVTPEDGKKYVILASDGYALTSEGDKVGYSNGSGDQQYNYYGLTGEAYNVGDDVAPDRLLWTFTASEDGSGYYIQSQDGKYLNGTYVDNDNGGYDGTLKLDDTRDVWIITGTTSGDTVSAHILKSTNASQSVAGDKYLTHGNGDNSTANIFSLRSESNATAATFYEYDENGTYVPDPDDPTPVDPPTPTDGQREYRRQRLCADQPWRNLRWSQHGKHERHDSERRCGRRRNGRYLYLYRHHKRCLDCCCQRFRVQHHEWQ